MQSEAVGTEASGSSAWIESRASGNGVPMASCPVEQPEHLKAVCGSGRGEASATSSGASSEEVSGQEPCDHPGKVGTHLFLDSRELEMELDLRKA